jgi:hypothetical protein
MVYGNFGEHRHLAKARRLDPNEYRIGERAHLDHPQIAPYDAIKEQALFDMEGALVGT